MKKRELKKLHEDAVPKALDRAMRYRLLNEPHQAESICRDVLDLMPHHQDALIILVLSLTDQFVEEGAPSLSEVRDWLKEIKDEYKSLYYTGVAYERKAMASVRSHVPESDYVAYELLSKAMEWYEKAEAKHPDKNDDSILRWNSCVRVIERLGLKPAPPDHGYEPYHD